ncbi:MAG: DUF1552 domain-containing protein [Rubripirellula sp.]|nr:DUF1552 domain-containing protein [Rubripirellula sp.]
MAINTALNRRTVLQSAGVSLTLPLLESMTAAWGSGSENPPKRSIFVCTALGLHPKSFWPQTQGADYELTPYLEILQPHRQQFTLFSGLQHEDQTGRQPHDSEMTFLTSARKPGMGGFRNTISIDQLAANQVGDATRFPSITLGTMKTQSQSYTRGGVMIPAQISPAKLFSQLFLEGKPTEIRNEKRKLSDGKSILDGLGSQARKIRRRGSTGDNHLLDDYFDSIRIAEKNILTAEGWIDQPKPKVNASRPADIPNPADIIGRLELLMNLIPLIIQTDSSRIVTVMVQDHFVVPTIDGVTGNHHNLSHHGQDPAKIEQLKRIESEIVQCFGSLLEQMKTRPESGGSLLDNTSILFGSNLGNANAHHANNLPILLAGGGFDHGRYIAQKKGTPLCNLFLTMLNRMGLEVDKFGQSSGTISWESA